MKPFVLKRSDVVAAGGYCRLMALLDRRADEGFADENGDIVYPHGFTQAEAVRIFERSPEALYWLECAGLVPCVELPDDLDYSAARPNVKAYLRSGPGRYAAYRERMRELEPKRAKKS